MTKTILLTITIATILITSSISLNNAEALTDCTFTTVRTIMNLDGNCTTDKTIFVPDGLTLDGNGNTITAVESFNRFTEITF